MNNIIHIAFLSCMVFACNTLAADPDMNFGGPGAAPCPPYRCPSGKVPVPNGRLQFKSSGCNMGAGGSMMMMPGAKKQKGATEVCCDLKNACYQTCGSTKDFCEQQQKKCTHKICDAMGSASEKEECEKDSSLQTMLASFGGCNEFDRSQYEACECVSKKNVSEKRKKVIQRFYEKYVSSGIGNVNVDTLVKKADSSKKMATLLTKLIAKYPNCIKAIQDPAQKRMEDMMKGVNAYEDVADSTEDEEEAVDIEEL